MFDIYTTQYLNMMESLSWLVIIVGAGTIGIDILSNFLSSRKY